MRNFKFSLVILCTVTVIDGNVLLNSLKQLQKSLRTESVTSNAGNIEKTNSNVEPTEPLSVDQSSQLISAPDTENAPDDTGIDTGESATQTDDQTGEGVMTGKSSQNQEGKTDNAETDVDDPGKAGNIEKTSSNVEPTGHISIDQSTQLISAPDTENAPDGTGIDTGESATQTDDQTDEAVMTGKSSQNQEGETDNAETDVDDPGKAGNIENISSNVEPTEPIPVKPSTSLMATSDTGNAPDDTGTDTSGSATQTDDQTGKSAQNQENITDNTETDDDSSNQESKTENNGAVDDDSANRASQTSTMVGDKPLPAGISELMKTLFHTPGESTKEADKTENQPNTAPHIESSGPSTLEVNRPSEPQLETHNDPSHKGDSTSEEQRKIRFHERHLSMRRAIQRSEHGGRRRFIPSDIQRSRNGGRSRNSRSFPRHGSRRMRPFRRRLNRVYNRERNARRRHLVRHRRTRRRNRNRRNFKPRAVRGSRPSY